MLNTDMCCTIKYTTQPSREKFGASDLTNDNLSVYHFSSKMLVTLLQLFMKTAH